LHTVVLVWVTDVNLSTVSCRTGFGLNFWAFSSAYIVSWYPSAPDPVAQWEIERLFKGWVPDWPSAEWRGTGGHLVAPFWFVLLVSVPLTAFWWYRDRLRPGYCRQCGYDLRASKKKCPECGKSIAPKPR